MDRAYGPIDRHDRVRRGGRARKPDRGRRGAGHVPGDGQPLPGRGRRLAGGAPAAPDHPPGQPDRSGRGGVGALPADAGDR
ncbi:hypothetical protein G6F64_014684 [Rhizopus arrhizus]|uniref:Uncharacterized protein n=1 Tax=Rhizopus oryzae TaxID=64495 RepID=A0A9P6WTG2_RHIOR|nr:hypothetical protein G6F64_014684 [Rhizopus arrhizus]